MNAVRTPSLIMLTKPTILPVASSIAMTTRKLPLSTARCWALDGRRGQPTKNPSSMFSSTSLTSSV
jgi:hypothetical protein